jgi:manganese transport protein
MAILASEAMVFQWLECVTMFPVGVIGVPYAIGMLLIKSPGAPILLHTVVPVIYSSSIYLAVSMLGATVMPHVVDVQSVLVLSCRSELDRDEHPRGKMELFDVVLAMDGAWLINS